MTILGTSPEIVAPDLVTGLEAITAMKGGTLAGGPELFPGSVIQLPPQVGGAVLVWSANPLKARGAGPPLRELTFAHCAPQKVTVLPTAALRSPITKEPLPRKAKTTTASVSDDGRNQPLGPNTVAANFSGDAFFDNNGATRRSGRVGRARARLRPSSAAQRDRYRAAGDRCGAVLLECRGKGGGLAVGKHRRTARSKLERCLLFGDCEHR